MKDHALDLVLANGFALTLIAARLLVPVGAEVAAPNGAAMGPACWLRQWLSVPCPTCGLTRSFVALAHGDIGAAFIWHPAGPMLFLAMGIFALTAFMALARRAPALADRPAVRWWMQAIAVAVVFLGLARSLLAGSATP